MHRNSEMLRAVNLIALKNVNALHLNAQECAENQTNKRCQKITMNAKSAIVDVCVRLQNKEIIASLILRRIHLNV